MVGSKTQGVGVCGGGGGRRGIREAKRLGKGRVGEHLAAICNGLHRDGVGGREGWGEMLNAGGGGSVMQNVYEREGL